MVETIEVVDSRTGATVECYFVDGAMKVAGVCRRTLERHTERGELTRLKFRGYTIHPVKEIEALEARRGARPGGATPGPKPRPNPAPPKGGPR